MSADIRYRAEARIEYAEAMTYYERQQPGLGLELEAQIEACIASIAEYPQQYPIISGDVREAAVSRFPYSIHFYCFPNTSTVMILSVYHQSRDPDGWKTRR